MVTATPAAPAAPATPATPATPAVAPATAAPAIATLASAAAAQPATTGTPATPATPATPVVVPDKYDLKLPTNAILDASVLERTAATARELGLSNEHAQKLLEAVNQEAATATQVAVETALKNHSFGGAEWTKAVDTWNQAALADTEIGGTAEKLAVSRETALRALKQYGSPELGAWLEQSGLGSNVEVLRVFARIGKAMGEPKDLVRGTPSIGGNTDDKSDAAVGARMFPSMAQKT